MMDQFISIIGEKVCLMFKFHVHISHVIIHLEYQHDELNRFGFTMKLLLLYWGPDLNLTGNQACLKSAMCRASVFLFLALQFGMIQPNHHY